jgi:hypothetical protein
MSEHNKNYRSSRRIHRKDENNLLKDELMHLDKSIYMLQHSYNICSQIGEQNEYSIEELDSFEALTGRFSRTSDIIVQKIFRLIDIIELEDSGTVIDRINRAEGRGLICSSEVFKAIRRLRNEIAHEYIHDVMEEIFLDVLEYTPYLIECDKKIKQYITKYDI